MLVCAWLPALLLSGRSILREGDGDREDGREERRCEGRRHDLSRQLVGEKGKLHPGESKLELRKGNQSGGQTVTLLVLPLNGFWLGFERQRLEASPIGELEQVLSMEKLLPPSP